MKNKAIDLTVQKYNKSKQQVFLNIYIYIYFGVINIYLLRGWLKIW